MQSYGDTTEQQKAVGTWLCDYAEHRQPFDEIKHRHTLNEVGDVAEGRYDWRIDRGRGGISLYSYYNSFMSKIVYRSVSWSCLFEGMKERVICGFQ